MIELPERLRDGARFSPCRQYRYALWRPWRPEAGYLNIIGLNPSTADEHANDPTIRRCIGFAQALGHGGLVMTNLFAWRATQPAELRRAADPVGPANDAALVEYAQGAAAVIAAWGVGGTWQGRDQAVVALLRAAGVTVLCLGRTREGHPRHPLYLRRSNLPLHLDGTVPGSRP